VLVTATLTNEGMTAANGEVGLIINDTEVSTRAYAIESGASQTVQFRYEPTGIGTETVAVGAVTAGSLTVTSGNGGLVPWGVLRAVALYIVLPVGLIYTILKGLAIYYGY